jgi:hypothetical protein
VPDVSFEDREARRKTLKAPALVAQEKLAADALFEPVDPAHQCGRGEPELFGRISETFKFCAS